MGLGLCFAWLYKQDRAVADDWVLRLRYAAHRPSRGGREGGRELSLKTASSLIPIVFHADTCDDAHELGRMYLSMLDGHVHTV